VRVIGGRYETVERIGGGGMADVFRAHDRTLDRYVAVKVMRPAFADDRQFVERFHREAEALGSIDHPNIVRVLDYGANPEDGPFIVMEFVGGGTLRDLLRSRGRIDQAAAAQIAAGIAEGLEAAHLRGVLHRDLKPDNVLLDGEGHPKIADFGIARLAAATALTRTGELLGTPQYLAPEQVSGDVVDERADVYALGVILYEMLTGTQPTGGTTPSEIVSRRLGMDPRPPARLVALSPSVNALVVRALARDPARRFARAADLRAALLAIRPPAPPVPPRARVVRLRLPSPAPLVRGLALVASSVRDAARRIASAAAKRRAAFLAIRPPALPTISRPRFPRLRGPSFAPLVAALALLAAFIGGSLVIAGVRPADGPVTVAPPPLATPTPAPTVAVLANISGPAVTATPIATLEPTPEPTPEPTAAPTAVPMAAPTIVATVSGDPAGTIVSFYELISGHDYMTASGLWSDRMRASYPPQTNIWGRFDSTRSIVTRSAAVTSATRGSAAVAVDLVETMRDGTTRRWVGTWYLIRSGSGWLLDQPGLRAG
jgi:serine/threonine-protein kinase